MKLKQRFSVMMAIGLVCMMMSLPGLAKDEDEPDLDGYIDKAAEKAAEDAMKAAEKAAEDAARAAEEAAEQAAEDAARAAEEAAEQAAEDASKAAEKAAEEAAEEAAKAAEKAAEDAAEDAAKSAEDAAEDAAKEAVRAAEEAAEQAAEQAEDAIDESEDLARDLARAEEDEFDDRLDKREKHRHEYEAEEREGNDDGHRSRNRNRSGKDDDRRGKSRGREDDSRGRSVNLSAGKAIIAQLERDLRGNEIVRNERLYAVSLKKAARLEKSLGKGAVTRRYPGLDMAIVKYRPDSDQRDSKQKTTELAVADRAVVSDHNHVYYGVAGLVSRADSGILPGELSDWPAHYTKAAPVIGVIDTALPPAYGAFRKDQLHQRSFVNDGVRQPTNHGLAVVSILAADSDLYKGLLPQSSIYLATVFEQDDTGVTRTSTERLVEALNWMVEMKIPVVNMSLTGPANQILEDAIEQAYARGTTVVSAVGNAGPHAAPMFPSAYDKVVAVTAVSSSKRVYRLANRGHHVDFAAPGVDILHPDDAGNRLTASSGTSMAAPFVAGLLAVRCEEAGESTCPVQSIIDELKSGAEDLGESGYDTVYGHGLVIR